MVTFKITEYAQTKHDDFYAEVISIIGKEAGPEHDVLRVVYAHNLPTDFPEEVKHEADSILGDLTDEDRKGREDLREIPFMTIDGETAKDFDDAVFARRISSGYVLYVAIADVSHYVKPGTALDKEAYNRGNSTYFPNHVIPMLPEKLSNGICSLNPELDRPVFVAEMKFDKNGNPDGSKFYKAVIKSKYRGIYEIAEKYFNHPEKPCPYPKCEDSLKTLDELWRKLRTRRVKEGMIELDIPSSEIITDDKGDTITIRKTTRLQAHILIEECMIAANQATAEFMFGKNIPYIYRVHDKPDEDSLIEFFTFLRTGGLTNEKLDFNNKKQISNIIASLKNNPAHQTIQMLLLRSMKQAEYSTSQNGHFGLSLDHYTHFTSPIRRYSDLLAHRALFSVVNKGKSDVTESKLDEGAAQCSKAERISLDAEREIIKIKKVRYIQKHLGQSFHGKISGMNENGIFVELKNVFVDGRIGLRDLGNDYYEFNAEKYVISGKRSKQTFRLGDDVEVQLVRADIISLEIDFLLLEHLDSRKTNGSKKTILSGEKGSDENDLKGKENERKIMGNAEFKQESTVELRKKNMDKLLRNRHRKK